MQLTKEQRETGKENFQAAIGSEHTRRDFLKGTMAAGLVVGGAAAGTLGSMYFKYDKVADPVRVGVIGTGDEGNVLINAINPNYVKVVAIADIRPYNVYRAFHGDWSSPNALANRCGLIKKYGFADESAAKKDIKVYTDGYEELLKDKDVEAVIIALPLHLHSIAAIKAMRAGKHVLTEKLMGHSVTECKEMGLVSRDTGRLLATGHQRHYSILYDNAMDLIRRNLIGYVHSIRAQWHRAADTWSPPLPGDKKLTDAIARLEGELKSASGSEAETLTKKIAQLNKQNEDKAVEAGKYGYEDIKLEYLDGKERTALEELIRWRLWNRTGGGLMAELGSHQLDASSLFISAVHQQYLKNDKPIKIQPLAVYANGGKHLYDKEPRDCEDHVYCNYEFPGPEYFDDVTSEKKQIKNKNKKIVVTYSSINGNGFGDYGEIVMGDKGTLVLDKEQEAMLFLHNNANTKVGVAKKDGKSAPTLDTTASGGAAAAVGKAVIEGAPISRGYTEEIEHLAWCIRNFDEKAFKADPDHYVNLPRCHPKVAMSDAIIALTTNMAIKKSERIEFKPEWFEIDKPETPEDVKPNTAQDKYKWNA